MVRLCNIFPKLLRQASASNLLRCFPTCSLAQMVMTDTMCSKPDEEFESLVSTTRTTRSNKAPWVVALACVVATFCTAQAYSTGGHSSSSAFAVPQVSSSISGLGTNRVFGPTKPTSKTSLHATKEPSTVRPESLHKTGQDHTSPRGVPRRICT